MVNYQDSISKGEYTYIADVLSYKDGNAEVEMRNRFKTGEELEVLSPDGNFRKRFTVGTIRRKDGEITQDAKLVQGIYTLECPFSLKKGDYLRRKNS